MTAEIDVDYGVPGDKPAWRGIIRDGTRVIHECPPGASVSIVPGRPGVFAVARADFEPYLVHADGTIEPIKAAPAH